VTTVAAVVLFTALGTIALKGAGPVLLGGRPLPARLDGVVSLAGPALLGALVAISTFTDDGELVLDETVIGVAAAAVAIRLHAPALAVVVVAAVVTAAVRALAG
jgi:branched-subunit amino acid transport protein